ncbi:type 1 periplasmic binding fold superfamily protein [Winogradskyella immobilis]|uniref:Type 1 periplasmic binding fold superfamily protein n=1 Tax=Winogradskyella immobilis TaxID=2816852 RepID=A0ABS8ELW8_9FLAO|nr:type 1 periplasmic binding fold superfamily protein [Winogradskyella immobilis]MCC1484153.1 type 1 periplasmic binding fold superfamily protein [Winogradskyella immobilis]MCG0016245.1 type 1 periplasmic binding fold superfamily protein [Winogradskyella immobilis]
MKTFKPLLLIALLILASCSDDDDGTPPVINDEEVITTLTVTLTPNGGGPDIVLTSRDLDGDGPGAAVITGGTLAANTTYTGVVQALNELEDPAEDITEEVAEEDDEHQFFFQAISGANITTMYTDFDGDGNPLGINLTLTTGDASNGTLRVTLRHLLDKNAAGVSEGDITNAGGDTDVEVDYPIIIQ